jgi:diguanylate cyclase (GGDEF)-like protein
VKIFTLLEALLDALAPEVPDQDPHVSKRVRMFLISHLFGPLLGLPIPLLLYFVDPQPFPHVHILALSVLAFWLFPLLIRAMPAHYTAFALLSILNLNFAILWGAYNYGGLSSPFMVWYLILPVLGFFYLGGSNRSKLVVFGQVMIGLGVFSLALWYYGDAFHSRIPVEELGFAGIVSVLFSTFYIFIMASYYTQILDSQSELFKEISRHEATLEMLKASKEEAENAKGLVEARNRELEAAQEQLKHASLHDALTGLPNRRYLDEKLSEDAQWCARTDSGLALLHIDLDRFKQINDTLGHSAGDVMLVHAANLLRASLREGDFLARIGGDEFIIVRRSETSTQTLTRMAEHITGLIRQPVPYSNHLCRFGASVGIAVESGADVDPKRLLINSDIALYRAKAHGRNRVEFFSNDLQAQIVHTKRVADDILRGLEQGEFLAYYQPQFDAKTFRPVGVEALARWKHPTDGLLAPNAFLSIADDLNVVGQIDRLVLEQVLSDLDRWIAAGLEVPRVSVNVSSKRLHDRDLISNLRELNIRPGTIAFELVEAIFLDEPDDVVEWNIAQLKELGIDIEIDDFGTGHASIVGLLKLSPKRLKIDRHFIRHIMDVPEHARLVGSIVEIGKSLSIEVAAEGVETLDQAGLLRKLGCNILQGHAFAAPMEASDLEMFMQAPSSSWRHVS